jgi:hypothetical protein
VGFAIEDFSALRYVRDLMQQSPTNNSWIYWLIPKIHVIYLACWRIVKKILFGGRLMAIRNPQAPNAVVRHHHFCPNPQTLTNNAFQLALRQDLEGLPALAYRQASDMAARLQEHGIQVHIFEDETHNTPDSVFPNNWFSTHSGGHVAIYPMFAADRRNEKRTDVIHMLQVLIVLRMWWTTRA